MAGRKDTNNGGRAVHPTERLANELEKALRAAAPQLYAALEENWELDQFRVAAGKDGGFWATHKKVTAGGEKWVAFGFGYDPFVALAALSGAIQAGRYRKDKPYEGS